MKKILFIVSLFTSVFLLIGCDVESASGFVFKNVIIPEGIERGFIEDYETAKKIIDANQEFEFSDANEYEDFCRFSSFVVPEFFQTSKIYFCLFRHASISSFFKVSEIIIADGVATATLEKTNNGLELAAIGASIAFIIVPTTISDVLINIPSQNWFQYV